MRFHLSILLVTLAALFLMNRAHAQPPASPGLPPPKKPAAIPVQQSRSSLEEELDRARKELEDFHIQQVTAVQAAQQDDKLKKQVELLQKQIETQQKMILLLLDHVKKQPISGTPVEKLQTQAATLEARSKQAAQRDLELSQAIDNIVEQRDADRRDGPLWPAPLKELFLPSQTNESPLSIYGTLTSGFSQFSGRHGNFDMPEFAPFFLVQLNDRFLMEVELEFGREGVEMGQAQVDFIANDWLTVVAGRFLAPVGFFNERLHPSWINKLPDFPLMFRQVSPAADLSLNGVQLRGAHYVFASPVKLEYSLFFANGLRLPGGESPELTELANLAELKETSTELNNTYAFGGRVGFWIPEVGLTAGFSAMFNGPYTSALIGGETPQEGEGAAAIASRRANDDFQLLQFDAGYHKGNWDLRFEYAYMFQNAQSFIGQRIERRGLYAQVAYRPYDAVAKIVHNTELVFRYSYANFKGIDPLELEVDEFEATVDVPVNRNQYTFGINYYFYPSLVLRLAYEINQEQGDLRFADNVFLAQLAWGF